MEISIRSLSKYSEVTFKHDSTTIETGLLDNGEVKDLSEVFLSSFSELFDTLSETEQMGIFNGQQFEDLLEKYKYLTEE